MNAAGLRLLTRLLVALSGAFLALPLSTPLLAPHVDEVENPFEAAVGAAEGSSTFFTQAFLLAAAVAAAALVLLRRLRGRRGSALRDAPRQD